MAGSLTRICLSLCLFVTYLTVCAEAFEITILHTNDFHSRIEETNKYSGPCSNESSAAGKCYGGSARIKTMVDQKRAQDPNVILLSAGDQFQGTLWYTNFGGVIMSEFMNLIGYDAMAVGNHEFDDGVAGLVPFVQNISFPLLSSNLDLSNTPKLKGRIPKSTVLTVDGQRIGIVGYTTKDTAYLSSPGTVTFTDELTAVQAEVDSLKALGINKIIALGHAGFQLDTQMGHQLRDVDIIIGGHTNTFLYTGTAPSNENPVGSYPYIVNNTDSTKGVLVVQDYAYGKYLGYLKVVFDDNGKVTGWSGNPVLLDSSVAKDSRVEAEIARYLPELDALRQQVIGQSHVLLENSDCRQEECSLGNVVADALVNENLRHGDLMAWSDVAIAMVNGGGIRTTITKGQITMEMALQVLPFRNEIDIVELEGKIIWQMLEHGISRYEENFGGFLQVAGLQVVFDRRRPVGSRVLEVKAVCTKCDVPVMEPLVLDGRYKVLMSSFISKGGDGYSFIPPNTISKHIVGDLLSSTFAEYVQKMSPIFTGLQGRIRFLEDIEHSSLISKMCAAVGDGYSIRATLALLIACLSACIIVLK